MTNDTVQARLVEIDREALAAHNAISASDASVYAVTVARVAAREQVYRQQVRMLLARVAELEQENRRVENSAEWRREQDDMTLDELNSDLTAPQRENG